jgi:hypothetical protein
LRIHGWLERDNGRHTEFFITDDGKYELRSANNDTLADSFEIIGKIAEAAKPLMAEPKKSSDWD